MRQTTTCSICFTLLAGIVMVAGCQNGLNWPAGAGSAAAHSASPSQSLALDQANEALHRQLAQARQLHQKTLDELQLVKQQLSETADQLRSSVIEQPLEAEAASAPTIRSTSDSRRPRVVPIAGLNPFADGDTVRIEIPADRLFEPGTSRLHSDGAALVDLVSQTIGQHYPRQLIAIEGYYSADQPSSGGLQLHQQTTNWSLSVLDRLVLGPARYRQLIIIGHGRNHPRYSSGSVEGRSRNQRIELVVYPDQVADGS
jgi:outer membrane protein OmpA-like peptidoglycan-associated protein